MLPVVRWLSMLGMDPAFTPTRPSRSVRRFTCRPASVPVKPLMLGAGVPAAIYNRYDSPENAKAKITRAVLDELQALGPPGWRVQRKIAAELCAMRRPANGVENIKAGRDALEQLRRAAPG